MKKYIILLGFSVMCLLTQAQAKWTLRQCVDYAIENNIELKQQALDVKNAEIELSTSKNSRLPDLGADVGQRFSFGRSTLANNVTESVNSSSTSFGISTSVPLFTGFRIPNQIKANELNLQAATEGLKKAQDNLELSVVSYFLEVLFRKEILKSYQEQAALTKLQVERTNTLVDAGKVPQSQLYDIKAQDAKNDLNVTMATNDLSLYLLNLSQALSLPSSANFDIEEPNMDNVIAENISSILPPEQVYQMALGIRPQIKEAEYRLESSRKSLKVAQSGYWPTLNFGAGYGTSYQSTSNRGNPSFSSQMKNNASEYINLGLSIPIFSRFQTRNSVRSARLSINNYELALENIKLALYKEIQQAYQGAVAAQAKFSSTEKSLDASEESFKYAKERYEVGKSTVFEYNEAQTQLLTSKSEQIQAKYDFIFKAKILDFYQGKEIDIK